MIKTLTKSRALVIGFTLGMAAALPASATWSVIITDSATGEVAIGSATCVPFVDLKREAGVVRVGRGAGAAQSFVEPTGRNRGIIFDELANGTDPATILDILEAQDSGHETRQYGIADTEGRAVGFSGSSNGAFANDVSGTSGTLAYAVQGNVITGQPVLDEAVAALLLPADLPTRLMRAMIAARDQGGDGRCSCSPFDADGCGAPPPDFDKSADVGYMLVARVGDEDGACNSNAGCASGDYYMDLNVAFASPNDPDPVDTLLGDFQAFRQSKIGVPDHYRTLQILTNAQVPADGSSITRLVLVARDLNGARITSGGASVSVNIDPSSDGDATVLPVVDRGNGIYIAPLIAGESAGDVRLRVTIDDGTGAVELAPQQVLELVPAAR
ncbi:MAG: DUF1028 domain-containing protein [Pseudomonadota bacterium]